MPRLYRPGGSKSRRAAFAACVEDWGEPAGPPPMGWRWMPGGPFAGNNRTHETVCLWCRQMGYQGLHTRTCPTQKGGK